MYGLGHGFIPGKSGLAALCAKKEEGAWSGLSIECLNPRVKV